MWEQKKEIIIYFHKFINFFNKNIKVPSKIIVFNQQFCKITRPAMPLYKKIQSTTIFMPIQAF